MARGPVRSRHRRQPVVGGGPRAPHAPGVPAIPRWTAALDRARGPDVGRGCCCRRFRRVGVDPDPVRRRTAQPTLGGGYVDRPGRVGCPPGRGGDRLLAARAPCRRGVVDPPAAARRGTGWPHLPCRGPTAGPGGRSSRRSDGSGPEVYSGRDRHPPWCPRDPSAWRGPDRRPPAGVGGPARRRRLDGDDNDRLPPAAGRRLRRPAGGARPDGRDHQPGFRRLVPGVRRRHLRLRDDHLPALLERTTRRCA